MNTRHALVGLAIPSVIAFGCAVTSGDRTEATPSIEAALSAPPQLIASEDSYVRSATPNTNYGAASTLYVQNSPVQEHQAFIKFDLNAITSPVAQALLTISVVGLPEGPPSPVMVYSTSDAWTEKTVTWRNRPAPIALLDTEAITSYPSQATFDVTSYIQAELAGDRIASLVLLDTTAAGKIVKFKSGATLALSYAPPPPPPGCGPGKIDCGQGCVSGNCCNNSDCGNGNVCVNNQCQPGQCKGLQQLCQNDWECCNTNGYVDCQGVCCRIPGGSCGGNANNCCSKSCDFGPNNPNGGNGTCL